MKEITKEEMCDIVGGGNPVLVISIIGAVVTFIIGVFSGYSNPNACNN